MKRRILSIITALALCLSLCPFTASAEEDPDGTEAKPWPCGAEGYNLTAWLSEDKTTLTIEGTGAMADYDVFDKKSPWDGSRSGINKVVLPTGLTTIGEYTFSGTSLQKVTIPEGVTKIGPSAFQASKLQEVTIPDSVTEIGVDAFSVAGSLKSVTIPAGVTKIGGLAFHSCVSLETVTFKGETPPEITVGYGGYLGSFRDCEKLTAIHVPHGCAEAYKTALTDTGVPEDASITAPEEHNWNDDGSCVCGAQAVMKMELNNATTYFTAEQLDEEFGFRNGNAGAVFTLLNDVTRTETLEIMVNCTLDLNGHTIRNTNYHCISIGSTANVTIRGEGEINAGEQGCALNVSGTAVLEGGTFTSRGSEVWPCVFVYGSLFVTGDDVVIECTSSDGYGLFVRGEELFDLRGGIYSGGGAAIKIFDSDSKTLADLLGHDGDTRYAYFNGDTPIALPSGGKELLGTVTVKPCAHIYAYTPTEGAETHSKVCPACGDTADTEDCTYEYQSVDETNHKGACVCGREKTEAHTRAEKWSPVWNEREVTITLPCTKECGYTEICGKVTVSADHLEIPYAQTQTLSLTSTLPGSTFTWTVSSDQGGGELTDTTLSTESSCTLPGDWNVGEYHVSWAVAWTGDGGQTVDGGVVVTVTPATLTGKPAFGSGEGKTLGEVEVTYPESWPEGVLSWNLPEDTAVAANTRYEWTFTPADTANYERLGGVVTLWVQSTGGGSGSSATTVPVSGDKNTVHVSARVSGTTATVSKIDTSQIENVIGDNGQASMVEIDFAGLGRTIDTVKLPAAAIKDIAAKAQNEEVRGLTVKLPEAEISFDAKALSAIQAQAGSQIALTVTPAKPASLNSRQKEAAGSAPVFDLTLRSGSGAISDFQGGYATVSLPYTLAAGQNPGCVVVYYLDSTGNTTPCTTMYDVGRKSAIFTTGHLSLYFVGYDPSAVWENPFSDVAGDDWYYDAVRYASENGLMGGYGNGKFGPNDNLSRAQFAQILFNKEGGPVVNYLLRYSDVADGAWYTEAVRWATSQGVVSGYGDGMFGPDDNITREQLAVMLWRYAGSPASTDKELRFTDADKASGYALEALCWAVENGVMGGYGDGQLVPQGLVTRAQVAQMLMNFLKNK